MTPERWLVITVRVPSEEQTVELAEGLVALGGSAVEESADLLTTYVPAPAQPEPFLRLAADRLARVVGGEPELRWRWQDDEDWSRRWRDGLEPRRCGRRLVITQPWNDVAVDPGDIVLVIEPATAFGTGEHATTRGALELLERVVVPGSRVLDVGTGSGILAIAAARLGAASVLAADSDPTALDSARENLGRNDVAARVELVGEAVDAGFLARRAGVGFDVIVANVLSGVLVPLLPPFATAIRPDGHIILGGILETEAPSVRAAAAAAGMAVLEALVADEWWTVLLRAR